MIKNIAKLFEIVGKEHHEEAIRWIEEFSKVDESRFGVIKVGGASVRDYLDDFCDGVSILASLGLYTPVVYGYGEQLDARLKSAGITPRKHPVTNDRITTADVIHYVSGIAYESGHLIVKQLKKRGIRARLLDEVFTAEAKHLDGVEEEHYTGEVKSVNVEEVKRLIAGRIVPVIPPLGFSEDGRVKFNVNGDTAANGLVYALKPLKYILVNDKGGIKDSSGNLIQTVVLDRDYQNLIGTDTVTGGMKKKLDEVKNILENLAGEGYAPSVQISHPQNLVRELFTNTGMGTYIIKKI